MAVFLSSAARRAHGSSAEHAMRDLIASNAPLRNGSHKARQNGPNHYPGDPTGAAAPLVCLSPLSFFKQRKMVPPEGVGKEKKSVNTRKLENTAHEVTSSKESEKKSVKTKNLKRPRTIK